VNQVLVYADELFNNIVEFKEKPQNYPSWDDFRNEIKWIFLRLETQAAKHKISNFAFQEMKYALVAYIDEMVLTSDWVQRDEWSKETLQLEFFKEHNAGEGFFQHLSDLRQGGEANLDLLEIYFICLQLGYKGKYQRLGEEKWQALQVDLKNQIDNYRGTVSFVLLPEVANEPIFESSGKQSIYNWGIIVASILIFTSFYLAEHWSSL